MELKRNFKHNRITFSNMIFDLFSLSEKKEVIKNTIKNDYFLQLFKVVTTISSVFAFFLKQLLPHVPILYGSVLHFKCIILF